MALLDQLAPLIAAPPSAAAGASSAARGGRPTLVRFDLAWPAPAGAAPAGEAPDGERPLLCPVAGRMRRAPVDVQPTSTVIVDLAADEAQVLARMKSKTRYNIRLAQRRGVEVAVVPAADALGGPLAEWYRLYRDTAARHHITAHGERYFATLFELAADAARPEPRLYLISAHHGGEPVGGIVVSVCGEMARYLYGASTLRHRALMGNYALQWAAMQLAREQGCSAYDLYGISPSADSDHPWAGLYRFKTGFGGTIEHRCGCWDYPVRPLPYLLFRRAEVLRRDYYARLRPRLASLRGRLASG
jgi:lipid II:glycine glycyltransferase (peptidoglycan interpeptide bridge formation enzyme)